MDRHYSQHYYSGIIPILPVKAIGIRLSSIYKVTSLVIYEGQTGILVLLKRNAVLLSPPRP